MLSTCATFSWRISYILRTELRSSLVKESMTSTFHLDGG